MKHTISFIALSAIVLLSSCVTTVKTARTAETSSSIKNATVADLKVTDHRITYTMSPSKEIQRAGLNNVKQAAIQEALTKHGNADVMVEPEFVISMKNNFIFGKKVTSITVSGRPAYYQNFRTLNDSVWATPGFYGQPKVVYASKGTQSTGFSAYGSKRRGILGLFGSKKKNQLQEVKSYDLDDGSIRRTGLGFALDFMGGRESTTFKPAFGGDYTSDGAGYFGVLGTIGYQISTHWFLGAGSGFIKGWESDTQYTPVYGNVRFYFSKRKNSFFLDYKVGSGIEVGGHSDRGGVFVAGSVGYTFGTMSIAFQVMNQNFKEIYKIDNAYTSRVGLDIGFKF